MKRLSLLVFHLKQIPVFLYSISNDRSSFDMPDSRRASEDLLLPQPRDVGPIMSPISEISGLVVNSNETIEETSEFEAAMKDRRASLTLPVNAQPCQVWCRFQDVVGLQTSVYHTHFLYISH